MLVRKQHPGGDSFGHQWAGGDTVDMTPQQAATLVAIDPDEFQTVDTPAGSEQPEETPDTPAPAVVTEPAPDAKPAKKTAAKKTAAAPPVQE